MRDLDLHPETVADLVSDQMGRPEVQTAMQQRLRQKGGAPAVQQAHRKSETRFRDGILRATEGLDLALAAARDKAIPEGADELIEEVADRVARLQRAVGISPTTGQLRRVK